METQRQQYRKRNTFDAWMPTEDPGLRRLRLANEGTGARPRPVAKTNTAPRTSTEPSPTQEFRTNSKHLRTQTICASGGRKRKNVPRVPRGMVWDVDEEVWTCGEVVGDEDPSETDDPHAAGYGAPSLVVTMENMEVAVLDFVENGSCNATDKSKATLYRYGEHHLDAAEQGNILHILAHYYHHYAFKCNMKDAFEDYKANGNNAKETSKAQIRKYGTFYMAPGSQSQDTDRIVDYYDQQNNVEGEKKRNLHKGAHDGKRTCYTPPSNGWRGKDQEATRPEVLVTPTATDPSDDDESSHTYSFTPKGKRRKVTVAIKKGDVVAYVPARRRDDTPDYPPEAVYYRVVTGFAPKGQRNGNRLLYDFVKGEELEELILRRFTKARNL